MYASARTAIEASSLFGHLPPATCQAVLDSAALEVYEAGEHVVEEGQPVRALFLIVDGDVAVRTSAPGGRRIELRALGRGGYFGEVSLLSGKDATATVEALGHLELLAIDHDSVERLMAEDAVLRRRLEGASLARAKDTIDKVLG